MAEVSILNLKGNKKRIKVELPAVFETVYRPDLIKRAVLAEQSRQRQPQGRFPLAGRQGTALSLGPGRGISKIPRTKGKRTHHSYRGTLVHSTVGGRLAFPPSTEKRIVEKINKKEHRLALWSAISATKSKETVEDRGHIFDDNLEFPLVVDDELMSITKTSEVKEILESLGLSDDLERTSGKKIRAGKHKRRGKKYRKKTGPLIVVPDDCDVMNAARNLAGVQICRVKDLDVEKLAPGTHPGRLTLWTESALKVLSEWR